MTTAPVQAVLDRLNHVKAQGDGQWIARCPSHDDSTPSLSVGVGDDGRALVTCHAGCATADVLAAMNPPMTEADLFPKGTNPNGQKRERRSSWPAAYPTFELAVAAAERQTRGKHADTWTYHKANGDGHFRIGRFDLSKGKTFRPFHRTKRGWVQTDPQGKLSLYRLPELLNADTVYGFEGERCVDAVHKLGLTATTSAHGCKSPHKSDWTPLAGKRVVWLPDADAGGRKYTQIVAGILTSLDPPASVKIVELPDLEEHGDIVDFIKDRRENAKDNNAIRAEIEALAEQAPVWTPDAKGICTTYTSNELTASGPYRAGESMRAVNAMSATARQLRETSCTLAEQVAEWLDRRGPEMLNGIDYPIPYAAKAIGVSRCHFHRLGQIGRVRRLLRASNTPVALSDRAIIPLVRLLPGHAEAIPQAIESAGELVVAEAKEQGRDKPKPVGKRHTSTAVDGIIGPVESEKPVKRAVRRRQVDTADEVAVEAIRQQIEQLTEAVAVVSSVPTDLRKLVLAVAKHYWSVG